MFLTLTSCGNELLAVEVDPDCKFSDMLTILPPRFRRIDTVVRMFFGIVELCGESTLSDIGVLDGSVLMVMQKRQFVCVLSGDDNTAKIWSAESGECLRVFTGHSGPVSSSSVSPDGAHVLTCSMDRTAKIWSVDSGLCLHTLRPEHGGMMICVSAWSPGGGAVLTCSGHKPPCIWSVKSGARVRDLTGHRAVMSAAFSPVTLRALTVSHDGSAKVWSPSGECVCTIARVDCHIKAAAFSPDGDRVITSSEIAFAEIWCATTGHFLKFVDGDRGHNGWYAPVLSAKFSPDGVHVATIMHNRCVKIWSASSCECLHTIQFALDCSSIEFSQDGKRLLATSYDQLASIWSVESGECLHAFHHDGNVPRVVEALFSPGGDCHYDVRPLGECLVCRVGREVDHQRGS